LTSRGSKRVSKAIGVLKTSPPPYVIGLRKLKKFTLTILGIKKEKIGFGFFFA
jgi:hypothetical protein